MSSNDITLWAALAAGILSFISPCCLPLYPSYLSYITGVSVKNLAARPNRIQKDVLLHTLFFILGFSIIFFALGLSASIVGSLFTSYRDLLRQLGGIIIFVMGLIVLGLFKPRWIMTDKRLNFKKKPFGYAGSILVGITFAAGWTPCIGPILTGILAMGVTNPNQALYYLIAYTMGFALPFFSMSFFIGKTKSLLKYSDFMMKMGGVMMMTTGVLLYTDQMTKITVFFIRLYGGFTGF